MLLRLLFIVFLNLFITYGYDQGKSYNYRVSSISQLVRYTTDLEIHDRHHQIRNASFKLFKRAGNVFEGLFVTNPDVDIDFMEHPFRFMLDSGQLHELEVSAETKKWHVSFIQAVLGPFQISTTNLKNSNNEFWRMEETISGNCSTRFKKSTESGAMGDIYKIVKTKDYTDCSKLPVFHRGIYGKPSLDALLEDKKILSRSTTSKITLIEDYSGGYVDSAVVNSEVELLMNNYTINVDTSLIIKLDNATHYDDIYDTFFVQNMTKLDGLSYDRDIRNHDESLHVNDYYSESKSRPLYNNRDLYGKELVLEITKKIAGELSKADDIPVTNTLERFTVLVEMIKNMDFNSLIKSGKAVIKNESEMFVFKSAVAMAGTLDALKTMEWFLKAGVMQSNDAILILGLPNRCERVTLEYLDVFFAIATESKLTSNQDDFEESAIIAFSNLIRRYYTENPSPTKRNLLRTHAAEKYLSYFKDKVKETYKSEKFQSYVRAIGNMGDGYTFEKLINATYYLSSMNMFQKMLEIISIDKIIELDPKQAQNTLLMLWNNLEDDVNPDVRLAIIHQLIKTKIDEDFIAEVLNNTKSSTEPLLRVGKKVKNILAEVLTYYLNNEIHNETDNEIEECMQEKVPLSCHPIGHLTYQHHGKDDLFSFLLEVVGGFDEVPSYLALDLKKNRKGFEKEMKVSGMLNYIKPLLYGELDEHNGANAKLSAGNILLDYDWNQYFYPFQNISAFSKQVVDWLPEDHRFMVKTLSLDSSSIDLPLENGFLFRYTYHEPGYLYLNFTKVVTDYQIDLTAHFLWSKSEQMKTGFVDPINGIQYLYGNNFDLQVNVPLSFSLTNDLRFILTLKPLFKNGTRKILHLGNKPYFIERSLHPIRPVPEEGSVEYIGMINEQFLFDVTNRLRFEMKGDEKVSLYVLQELTPWDLSFKGPFRTYLPIYSTFTLMYEENPKDPTTLAIFLDFFNQPRYANHTDKRHYGHIKGPFVFSGSDMFHLDALLPSVIFTKKDLTASVTLKELVEMIRHLTTKYEGKFTLRKGKEIEMEACVVLMYEMSKSGEDARLLTYADVGYGSTCKDSFMSLDADVNFSQTKRYLDATIDFQNVGYDISDILCLLKGRIKNQQVSSNYGFNLHLKDEKKCL